MNLAEIISGLALLLLVKLGFVVVYIVDPMVQKFNDRFLPPEDRIFMLWNFVSCEGEGLTLTAHIDSESISCSGEDGIVISQPTLNRCTTTDDEGKAFTITLLKDQTFMTSPELRSLECTATANKGGGRWTSKYSYEIDEYQAKEILGESDFDFSQ